MSKKTQQTSEPPRRVGRPSEYTKEKGDLICSRLSDGESLRSICRDENMPNIGTVLRWVSSKDNDEFRTQYAHAREIGLEHMAEEILEICDDGSNDFMEKATGSGLVVVADHEHIQRSKLRVDTRKWVLSKLLPKKYGEKASMELTGADGGAIQFSDSERAAKIQAIMAAAQQRKGTDEGK
jgi:hypothetical protein